MIHLFPGINVPRSRFLPVKKTSDLLLVKSNLYETNDAGALMMSPKRHFASTPFVQLSGPYFWKVRKVIVLLIFYFTLCCEFTLQIKCNLLCH